VKQALNSSQRASVLLLHVSHHLAVVCLGLGSCHVYTDMILKEDFAVDLYILSRSKEKLHPCGRGRKPHLINSVAFDNVLL
jgi:hypothetical protein